MWSRFTKCTLVSSGSPAAVGLTTCHLAGQRWLPGSAAAGLLPSDADQAVLRELSLFLQRSQGLSLPSTVVLPRRWGPLLPPAARAASGGPPWARAEVWLSPQGAGRWLKDAAVCSAGRCFLLA